MNTKEYTEFVCKTSVFDSDSAVPYLTLGLTGEAGELANKIKKVLRGDKKIEEIQREIILELGDILWYTSRLAVEVGSNLQEILDMNVDKLTARLENKTLRGDGDNR